MPLTAEQKAAAKATKSAYMKKWWADRKAGKTSELPQDAAIKEAMAKTPMNAVIPATAKVPIQMSQPVLVTSEAIAPARVIVQVDWQHLPMLEAQQFYACLKTEFETAGRILNARSMERTSGYDCFMCHKHFNGQPGFTDHSYTDPATGLSPRVDCCGELCVINYNAMRINQRHQRDTARAQQERGE
jgi:hypothetical protein